MAQTKVDPDRHDGAFTLMEMMIVLVILIIVMALILPVIGNARNAAKRTNTRQLLNNLSQASQQFELSERRLPGYFNATDMGSTANRMRGLTEMENILLDLAGGTTPATGAPPQDSIEVGPTAQTTVFVRTSLIGAPTQTKGVVNKGYFTPDAKYFELQDTTGKKVTSVADHLLLPDLVDGFGQPILAWRQDIEPAFNVPFAAMDSTTRASFYWTPNKPFLNATRLGRREQNQTTVTEGANGSLLTESFQAGDNLLYTMHGLLGNPAFPVPRERATTREIPAAARGKLIFHSAGTDGTYLGVKDRGGIIATSPTNGSIEHTKDVMDYHGGRDPLDNFDDVVHVAGN